MGKIIAVAVDVLDGNNRALIREKADRYGYQAVFCTKDSPDALQEAEIIYAGMEVLSYGRELKHVRWFHACSAGVDAFLRPGILPEGCLLSNSSGAYGVSVAEHGFTMTMMLLRRMPEYMERAKAHIWGHDLKQGSMFGSRITVLGTGDIGLNYASRARAFCPSEINAVNRSGVIRPGGSDAVAQNPESLFDSVRKAEDLDELLPETDILFMSLPGTDRTYHMINRERLALLPDSAVIVNVGRGNSIDQAALCEALNAGKLAGAGLDVFEKEPVPEGDPVWTAKNLLITTHCAGWLLADHTRRKNVRIFCENLEEYCTNGTLLREVDRSIGY